MLRQCSAFALVLLVVLFVLATMLRRGEERERQAWLKAPSTLQLYSTEETCVDEPSGRVLNCGHCGKCSNVNDIGLYNDTRSTLTGIMTQCAKEGVFLGRERVRSCLVGATNMTEGCAECWVQNFRCNRERCTNTCVREIFFPFVPSISTWDSHPLSPCVSCDEKLCGPEFLRCAGANRRRVGVVSDLQRDMELEICDKVDWEWIIDSSSSSSSQASREAVKNEL